MRSRECKQKWVTYKRDLTLADYHNHRTWCPNLRVVVQHGEEFHNRLLILPIESVALQQKKKRKKAVLGFGFEVWVFSAPSDSSSSGATQAESLELLPDWFEVLEEPDLMEFQVCFHLPVPAADAGNQSAGPATISNWCLGTGRSSNY